MWHEARKQEKKIRGMMVDYRKRAERRRDFYEKFKADPTQFLQLHGRPCKIHLDQAVAVAGDSTSVMMPWQGHPDILIDRFDVRAHLDSIVEVPSAKNEEEVLTYEERTMNYERYRILVQNEFLGVNEEKFLHQIYLEEQFGPIALKQNTEMLEKEKRKKGVAISFTYEDSTSEPAVSSATDKKGKDENADKDGSDSDDSDLDFDLCLDLSQIDTPSAHEMNAVGHRFGLVGNDFFSFLTNDVEEQEAMRLARQQEEEKAMFSGRKARRERQAFREKKLLGRVMSPPSYAARKSPTYDKYTRCNKSLSRSTSPENAGEITYITSFGGEDSNDENQEQKTSKPIRKPKTKGSKDRDDKCLRLSSNRARRSKSLGSRSRSKSPKRRRKYSRSRSMEDKSLASNLKKLISKKNERRSRSGSSDRYRSYSKWRSRSRSRSEVERMHRVASLRCTERLRVAVRQRPILKRLQHETVRPSEEAVSKVSKKTSETNTASTGPANSFRIQQTDDSLLKSSPAIPIIKKEGDGKKKSVGEEHWERFQGRYRDGTVSLKDLVKLFKGVYTEAQYAKFQEAPSSAYTITCCSVLPLCSIGLITLVSGGAFPSLAYVQLTYSASILSFLGGIAWGHTMSQKKISFDRLGWSLAPPILAWFAVMVPLPVGLVFTAVGLTSSMIHDILLSSYPQWFKSLRYIVTIVALVSFVPTFFTTALNF